MELYTNETSSHLFNFFRMVYYIAKFVKQFRKTIGKKNVGKNGKIRILYKNVLSYCLFLYIRLKSVFKFVTLSATLNI